MTLCTCGEKAEPRCAHCKEPVCEACIVGILCVDCEWSTNPYPEDYDD